MVRRRRVPYAVTEREVFGDAKPTQAAAQASAAPPEKPSKGKKVANADGTGQS